MSCNLRILSLFGYEPNSSGFSAHWVIIHQPAHLGIWCTILKTMVLSDVWTHECKDGINGKLISPTSWCNHFYNHEPHNLLILTHYLWITFFLSHPVYLHQLTLRLIYFVVAIPPSHRSPSNLWQQGCARNSRCCPAAARLSDVCLLQLSSWMVISCIVMSSSSR